jgi:tetratricopeptide (TPR) repeat protein
LSYLVISCFGLLVFIEYNSHYFYNNKHKYYFAWDYGRNILKPLKQDSILITKGDAIMFPLWYLQYVEQMRMDVICVFSPYLHKRWHVNQLQQRYPEIFGEKISSDDEKKLKTIMLKKILYQVHLGRACYTLMDSKIPDEFTLVPVGIFHQIVTDRNKEKIKEEVLNSMVEFNIRGLHDPKIYQSDWRTRQEIIWNYASGYNNYGFFYSIHNQTEKAIIAYKKAIEIKPEDVVFHINLAKTYLAVDMIQDAIREFRFAIQLSPENADLYNDLGSIYGRCRMYKEAINMFNKAKQYSPSDIKSYRNIASAYYQLGEYRLAKKECIEGLKLMPNDMYLQRMLKVLNRITKEG